MNLGTAMDFTSAFFCSLLLIGATHSQGWYTVSTFNPHKRPFLFPLLLSEEKLFLTQFSEDALNYSFKVDYSINAILE